MARGWLIDTKAGDDWILDGPIVSDDEKPIRVIEIAELENLREVMEIAADQLALASQLAQDRGISNSCQFIRRELKNSYSRHPVQ